MLGDLQSTSVVLLQRCRQFGGFRWNFNFSLKVPVALNLVVEVGLRRPRNNRNQVRLGIRNAIRSNGTLFLLLKNSEHFARHLAAAQFSIALKQCSEAIGNFRLAIAPFGSLRLNF